MGSLSLEPRGSYENNTIDVSTSKDDAREMTALQRGL